MIDQIWSKDFTKKIPEFDPFSARSHALTLSTQSFSAVSSNAIIPLVTLPVVYATALLSLWCRVVMRDTGVTPDEQSHRMTVMHLLSFLVGFVFGHVTPSQSEVQFKFFRFISKLPFSKNGKFRLCHSERSQALRCIVFKSKRSLLKMSLISQKGK